MENCNYYTQQDRNPIFFDKYLKKHFSKIISLLLFTIFLFTFSNGIINAQTNLNNDPRDCGFACAAGDVTFSPFIMSATDDGDTPFDITGCNTSDTLIYICFTITDPTPRGRVIVALDLYENEIFNETILRCYAGPNPSGTTFCTEYNYTCGSTLTIIPGYLGWANDNNPGNPCNENLGCMGGNAFHPSANCIGYIGQELVCEDMMNNLSLSCNDPCIDEACCEVLSGSTAPAVNVEDSMCSGETPTGGSFTAPNMDCPLGSTIEYSSDEGATWVDTIIDYDQNNAITVWSRCVCDYDEETAVSDTSMVTSSPALCSCDDLSMVNPPAVEIESESTCNEIGGTPSGGAFADPPVSTNTCPDGSALEWSSDEINWDSDFNNFPSYDQENPITIYTRCNCVSNTQISSPTVSVTTVPGICPNNIPTLSEWGLLILMQFFMIIGLVMLRSINGLKVKIRNK